MTGRAVDTVVIGAGVIGASCAYYLTHAGCDVLICDRLDVCSGTSARCDGNVLLIDKMPGYDSKLARLSLAELQYLSNSLCSDIEYSQNGSTLVIERESELELARSWVGEHREYGLPIRLLDASDMLQLEPGLARDIAGGIECDIDAAVNPMALAFALINDAVDNGCELRTFTPVTEVLIENSRVCGVRAGTDIISCQQIIIAAGVWTSVISAACGVNVPITPRHGQLLVVSSPSQLVQRNVMEFGYLATKLGGGKRNIGPEHEKSGIAFVCEPSHGNYLIGSSRMFSGYETDVCANTARLIAERACRFIPDLKQGYVMRMYAGVRPWTGDHRPIISKTDIAGLFIASGHEGDGIGLAAITGKLIMNLVMQAKPSIDVTPLSISRSTLKSG